MANLRSRISAALGVALALSVLVAEPADARRGGSFGSRGSRTYSQPRSTRNLAGLCGAGAEIDDRARRAGQPGGAFAPRPGMPGYAAGSPYGGPFGGFRGGGFLGGLVAGGLIGGLMGHGWGGGWGGYGYFRLQLSKPALAA